MGKFWAWSGQNFRGYFSLVHCDTLALLCCVIWHRITVSAVCHHLSSSGLDITDCSHCVTQLIFWGEIEWVSGNITQQRCNGIEKVWRWRAIETFEWILRIFLHHSLALACIRRRLPVVGLIDVWCVTHLCIGWEYEYDYTDTMFVDVTMVCSLVSLTSRQGY